MKILIFSLFLIIIMSSAASAAENTTDINGISSDYSVDIEKIQNDNTAYGATPDVKNNNDLLKEVETKDNGIGQENSSADNILSSDDTDNKLGSSYEYEWNGIKYNYSLNIGPGSYVTVSMPNGGSGIVKVYSIEEIMDGGHGDKFIEIGSGTYKNGAGKIMLTSLSGGKYEFVLSVAGETLVDDVIIKPKITIPEVIGKSGIITFELYKAKGNLKVFVDGVLYTTVKVTDGKAKVKLQNLGNGKHTIKVKFYGTGKNIDLAYFNKIAPDKEYRTFPIYYNFYKYTTKTAYTTAKQSIALYKTDIKKSSKYITLSAKLTKKLENQKVTFTIKGKTYTSTTNSKGIATVKIKTKYLYNSLVVGKRASYSATYLKDTAKIAVIVQK